MMFTNSDDLKVLLTTIRAVLTLGPDGPLPRELGALTSGDAERLRAVSTVTAVEEVIHDYERSRPTFVRADQGAEA